MDVCILCHNSLLRHIRQGDIHWFCTQCRQEMPSIALEARAPVLTEEEKDLPQPLEAIDIEANIPALSPLI